MKTRDHLKDGKNYIGALLGFYFTPIILQRLFTGSFYLSDPERINCLEKFCGSVWIWFIDSFKLTYVGGIVKPIITIFSVAIIGLIIGFLITVYIRKLYKHYS